MAEQNEGHVALSIVQENSTANTSNPAEKTGPSLSQSSEMANFSAENGHPETNDNSGDEVHRGYLYFFVVVIIVIIAVIAILVFVLVIAPIVAITVLPLLLALYFIAHIVLVLRTDDDYELSKFMGALAKWLCFCFVLISIDLLLCMLIFGVTPSLKHRKVHDELSITRLIGVLAIICVFLTYSMVTRYVLGYRRTNKEHSEEETHLFEGVIGGINSLFYLSALFAVTRVAPILKEHTVLGLPTYKWIRMILLVLLGHRAISIFTSSIAVAVRKRYFFKAGKERINKVHEHTEGFQSGEPTSVVEDHTRTQRLLQLIKHFTGEPTSVEEDHEHTQRLLQLKKHFTGETTSVEEWIKYADYYAEGLRRSFNFLLTSLLVLLTWILYFGSRLDRSSSHTIREVYDIGFWTSACILASAFLWLVMCDIILSLKARFVYDKLCDQVSGAAKQLYLIGIIAGRELDILGVGKKEGGGGDDHTMAAHTNQDEGNKEGPQVATDQPTDRLGSDGATGEGKTKENNKPEKQNARQNPKAERARKILVGETKKDHQESNKKGPQGATGEGEGKANNTSGKENAKSRAGETSVADTEEDQEESNKKGLQGATSKDQSDQPADRPELDGATGEGEGKSDGRAKSRARDENNESKDILRTSSIMRMARYFMDAEKPLSRDSNLSEFVERFRKNNPEPIKENKKIRDLDGVEIGDDDDKLFKKQLKEEGREMEDIIKWITRNYKVCLKLGRTLAGAMEVVDSLNNILIIILVTAVTIVWLLITRIATTRVLVLIAAPILSATFIFGESAKTWFQGLMFIYVTHPFDVGDLCTIENVQVEVKRIGVWNTKFFKVGTTDDEIVYPNTTLAQTSFINHGKKVDPNDNVELTLSSTTTTMKQIEQLESKIKNYMADVETKFNEDPDRRVLAVKDIGETIGISVYFKHDEESIKDTLPTNALTKKTQSRNEFLRQVKTFLDGINMEESRKP